MDVQLFGFTKYQQGAVTKNADVLRERALQLMATDEFSDLVRHTISEQKRVERRFRLWLDMLDEVLGDSDQGPRLFPRELKQRLFTANPSCSICGQQIQSIDDAHLDHVVPYSKGGATKVPNAALTALPVSVGRAGSDGRWIWSHRGPVDATGVKEDA